MSRSFRNRPLKEHLVRPGGVGGEISVLREEVERAFATLEEEIDNLPGGGGSTAASEVTNDSSTVGGADVAAALDNLQGAITAAEGATADVAADLVTTNGVVAGKITSPGGPQDGDILVRTGGAWARLPAGNDGDILQITGGAPVWTPPTPPASSAPKIVVAEGFSAANYLASGAGVYNGASTMTIMAMVRLAQVQNGGGTQVLIENGNAGSVGYTIMHEESRPSVAVGDGAFTKISTGGFQPDWSPGQNGDPLSWGFIDWKTAIIGLIYNQPALTIMVNMIEFRTINLTDNPGYSPGANGMRIGARQSAADPFGGGVVGMVYADAAFSVANLRTWMRLCMEECDVVPGALAWDNLISFKQQGLVDGDPVPATMTDQIGSNDFTLNGSLTVREETPRWL